MRDPRVDLQLGQSPGKAFGRLYGGDRDEESAGMLAMPANGGPRFSPGRAAIPGEKRYI